jgi:hypothetical protein
MRSWLDGATSALEFAAAALALIVGIRTARRRLRSKDSPDQGKEDGDRK